MTEKIRGDYSDLLPHKDYPWRIGRIIVGPNLRTDTQKDFEHIWYRVLAAINLLPCLLTIFVIVFKKSPTTKQQTIQLSMNFCIVMLEITFLLPYVYEPDFYL